MTYGGRPSLSETHPELAAQWDYERNRLSPLDITAGSSKKVGWVCHLGHTWSATVTNRTTRGSGCRVCSGRGVLEGFNDLATTHPHVASQWHPSNTLKPTEVTHASSRKAMWKCELGHTWTALISNRTSRNSGCRICDGKEVLQGFNDLRTRNPRLADNWHPANSITPEEVTQYASIVVKWRCAKGHKWESSVLSASHLSPPHYCGVCSGRKLLKGYNDLGTTHPDIAKQWDSRNHLSPEDVTAGSERAVTWRCNSCDHVWDAAVKDRTRGRGCLRCARGQTSSRGEKELAAFVVKSVGGGLVTTNVKGAIGGRYEVDVYVPDLRVGFEFNGVYYHSDEFVPKEYHADKFHAAQSNGIRLIQVWEDDWRDRRRVVESIVLRALKSHVAVVDNASLTTVRVSKAQVRNFLAENSLERYIPKTDHLALTDIKGCIRAVMLFSVAETRCVINVYTTYGVVEGGFSALLEEVERKVPRTVTHVEIRTDNSVTDGAHLSAHGFTLTKELDPEGAYVWKNTRGVCNGKETRKVWNAGTRIWMKEIRK